MSSPYDGLVPNKPKPEQGESTMGKGLFRSRTFWFNALTAVVSLGAYFQNSELLTDNPEVVAGIGSAVGFVNILLRLVTKKPIQGVVKK